jgi:hypothetical protein
MKGASERTGLQVAGVRELLLPVTVAACFVLYYVLELPAWVLLAVGAPMLATYALAPTWAAQSVASFDRDLVRLLSTGARRELPWRYTRAIGMRLFAAPAVRAERRAVVAAENGEVAEARSSYREALREYGGQAPLRVQLGYAHACYGLCDDDEAIRVYRALLDHAGSLPGVRRNLAHALVRRGDSLREALELIEIDVLGAESSSRRAERDLLRAVAHAKLGERARARQLLESSPPPESTLALSLRAELERAMDGAISPR